MLFQSPTLDDRESTVLRSVEALRTNLRYATNTPARWTGLLRRNAFARAVRGSNSIEGFNVTMEDAIAAVEGEEPMDPRTEAWMAVTGYRRALTFVLQRAEDPHFRHSEEMLKSLHYMMLDYDLTKNPGRWRHGSIFVRNDLTGDMVYEGPPAETIQPLVEELVGALNAPGDDSPLIAAAMAHLNLVMIHPFSDGNGRMARGLQTLVLARGGSTATPFSSIEEYLGRNTEEYYAVLSEVGAGSWSPERDARPWVRFCLRAHYHQALTLLRRSREMHSLWDRLEATVERLGGPERTVLALVDAAFGWRVRNATYRVSAMISEAVAARDLKLLVAMGLLEKRGENRGRFYVASPAILEVRRATSERRLPLPDPFGEGTGAGRDEGAGAGEVPGGAGSG